MSVLNLTHRQGMTLIEVLAVVVILSLLAVTLTVGLSGKLSKAKREICKTQIAEVVSQVQAYQLIKHSIPTVSQGLQVLGSDRSSAFYLSADKTKDPWGNSLRYLVPGPHGAPFEVMSLGADGQPGGQGEAADISSANLSGE